MRVRPRGILITIPDYPRLGLKQAIYDFVKTRTERKQSAPSIAIAKSFMLPTSKIRQYLLELREEGKLEVNKEGWYTL